MGVRSAVFSGRESEASSASNSGAKSFTSPIVTFTCRESVGLDGRVSRDEVGQGERE